MEGFALLAFPDLLALQTAKRKIAPLHSLCPRCFLETLAVFWVLGIAFVETLAVALGFLKARKGLQAVKVQLEKTQAVIPLLRSSQHGAWGWCAWFIGD